MSSIAHMCVNGSMASGYLLSAGYLVQHLDLVLQSKPFSLPAPVYSHRRNRWPSFLMTAQIIYHQLYSVQCHSRLCLHFGCSASYPHCHLHLFLKTFFNNRPSIPVGNLQNCLNETSIWVHLKPWQEKKVPQWNSDNWRQNAYDAVTRATNPKNMQGNGGNILHANEIIVIHL